MNFTKFSGMIDVVTSINYSFEKRQMSICQKRGIIITLVPKKDKPTNLLGNLRPISLLNTDYKIATKAIAKRLEAVVLNLFHLGPDFKNWIQTFYRNITSCVTNKVFASDVFNLEREVLQGCPLSDMLFVLGIEILALAIYNTKL